MRRNIYAFTEARPDFPAYISVNEEDGGDLTVTSRTRGNSVRGNPAAIVALPYDEAEKLALALLKYLGRFGNAADPGACRGG